MSHGLMVYVAGPYTQGSRLENVRKAMAAADEVGALGHRWFIPHLSHYHDQESFVERSYEDWMSWCLAWVERCDVLLRIAGRSPGADREVAHAKANGIPVVNLEGLRHL